MSDLLKWAEKAVEMLRHDTRRGYSSVFCDDDCCACAHQKKLEDIKKKYVCLVCPTDGSACSALFCSVVECEENWGSSTPKKKEEVSKGG